MIDLSSKNCLVHENIQGIKCLDVVLFRANINTNIKLKGIVADKNLTCNDIRCATTRNKCSEENPINDCNI